MNQRYFIFFLQLIVFAGISSSALAWSEHTLLVRSVLNQSTDWAKLPEVEVKSLERFLFETAPALEEFFITHNQRYNKVLPVDALLPEALFFMSGNDSSIIRKSFLHAIRINPDSKLPLYLYLYPGQEVSEKDVLAPSKISTLNDLKSIQHVTYIQLVEGERVSPFEVLVTANDEPDYGFDLGLFIDNNTTYGKMYSFGNQPYGNPNLEYSSQAPFHMGFYHEAWILYRFGPFLKRTFLEYRVHLYRDLSILAFQNGQDYWGWRFLGWSMHYAGDATMPYHTKPLPGYSTLRMIWINLKAMLGFKQARKDAIQLVSNKHTAIESYQHQVLLEAYRKQDFQHIFFRALSDEDDLMSFDDQFIKQIATKRASVSSKAFEAAIVKYMPEDMVLDPSTEITELKAMDQVVALVREKSGEEGISALNEAIAERFRSYGLTIRALFEYVNKQRTIV